MGLRKSYSVKEKYIEIFLVVTWWDQLCVIFNQRSTIAMLSQEQILFILPSVDLYLPILGLFLDGRHNQKHKFMKTNSSSRYSWRSISQDGDGGPWSAFAQCHQSISRGNGRTRLCRDFRTRRRHVKGTPGNKWVYRRSSTFRPFATKMVMLETRMLMMIGENSKLETPRLEEHGHEVSSCESELMRL